MRALLIGLVGAVLAVGGAGAQDGHYRSIDRQAHIEISMGANGALSANIEFIGRGGCLGGFSGPATEISKDEAIIVADYGDKQCRIKLTRQRSDIVMREIDGLADGCGYLHGANCSFDRTLTITHR